MNMTMITERDFKEYKEYRDALEENFEGSYSSGVLEKLIVLFGEANTGKTSSLKQLAIHLGMPQMSIMPKDIRIILHPTIHNQVKNVFLSTFGDSVRDVINNIHFFNMANPSGFHVFEVIDGKIEKIETIEQKPDICIGASRVEEMHWNLYELFTQAIEPKIPKPIMFRKNSTKPKPQKGTLSLDDEKVIKSILNVL